MPTWIKPRSAMLTSCLRSRVARIAVCLLVVLLLRPAAATDPRLTPEIDRLLDLIEHRAHLMPDVARWKWHRDLPVTDPQREDEVLARATRDAVAAGLEPDGARALVAAQMGVARDIQATEMRRFERAPPKAGGPDLDTALRPAIGATTAAILAALPPVLPLLPECRDPLQQALNARLAPLGVEAERIDALVEALTLLRPFPPAANTLDRVLATGVLRIGTTLDYPPFSFVGPDGEPDGIDVTFGRLLAESLDAKPEFVVTSWPTLMADLAAGRFDIGMSGISRTVARARVAAFSAAYHTGGKTPIIRCEDQDRFDAVERIDREGVRVIVNPGGTNEVLTRAVVTRAGIRVFDDNTRIFDEIAEGRADVMFTDAIEVRLQTARNPQLCAAMPGRALTFQEKGFLLPQEADSAWRHYVDLWLAAMQGDGTRDALFERYLDPASSP